jgi:hypothetical protein
MTKAEKISIGVGAIGIVIGVLFGVLGIKSNWDIAAASGSFERPVLTLGIDKLRLSDAHATEVMVGAGTLSGNGSVLVGQIPFSLANEGRKTVDTPTITIRYHEWLKRRALEALEITTSGSFSAREVEKSFTEQAPFEYVSYRAASLNPGLIMAIREPMYIRESSMHMDVPVEFKDGVSGIVPIDITYAITILVTTSGRDIPVRNYPIELMAIKTSSVDEFVRLANESYVSARRKRVRQTVGFWSYLASLLFRSEERGLFLVYLTVDEYPTGEGKLYFARPDPEVRFLRYDLLEWKYLF